MGCQIYGPMGTVFPDRNRNQKRKNPEYTKTEQTLELTPIVKTKEGELACKETARSS